jgi:zinc transport system substrate-binding protein
VASFYPLAEAARQVGGNAVAVTNLTPPGVEPHDLELAPDDLEAIATADVVIYLGGGFQPAVEQAVQEARAVRVDVLDGVQAAPAPESEAADGLTLDPHIWLDPVLFQTVVAEIAGALARADPGAAERFEKNASSYEARLMDLDREMAAGLAECRVDVIVTNHAAFGYLAAAFGFSQEAISGLEPESEPDPRRLAQLKDLVEREGITTIFTEELVSPEVAQTLGAEAGVGTAVLNTLEGEPENGGDYISVMRSNLETLRQALGCG